MRDAQTLVGREDRVANVNDSRLLAINVERLILSPSSLPQAGRYCAAIASVLIARHNKGPESRFAEWTRYKSDSKRNLQKVR